MCFVASSDASLRNHEQVQAAGWLAGLVGRPDACWKKPAAWPENAVFRRYFESRLTRIRIGSGVRD